MPNDHEFLEDGWLPQLVDILHRQEEEQTLPEPERYWSLFGWDALEVPADCPLVVGAMPELGRLFNERYMFRMLGMETMEQWQTFLQSRFDMGVHRLQRGLELYAAHQTDMAELGESQTRVIHLEDQGTDVTTGRSADTPYTQINLNDSWGDSVTKSDGMRHNDRTGNETISRVDASRATDDVNASIDRWKDLTVEFIGTFENCFLNIMDY